MEEPEYLLYSQILKHLDFLADNTENLKKITTFLISKQILSVSEEETIFGIVGNRDKLDVFYKTFRNKNQSAFLYLIQSLIFSNNTNAAKILTENYRKLILGGRNSDEVIAFRLSDLPPTLKSALTSLELTFIELHRNDLENLGQLTKLQELKLVNFRLFGKLQSTWITKPLLSDLKVFIYEEIPPLDTPAEKYNRNLKSVFFFSTKSVQMSKMEIRVSIYNVVMVDTRKSLKNGEMCIMTLGSIVNADENSDVWLTCDKDHQVIEIMVKTGEIVARSMQKCLMASQKVLQNVETFRIERCTILGDFEREIRVSFPKLKLFDMNVKGNVSFLKKSDYFEKILFFNKFWDIPWAVDEIFSLNVNIRVVLNDIFICGVDHSQPSINFVNRGSAESSEALLESVRNQRLKKISVISSTTETRSHILSWHQNIQPHLLTNFTFVGPYTVSLSTLLRKCEHLRHVAIWNERETIAQKFKHNSFRCGIGVNADSMPNPSDSFELKPNFVTVSLYDLNIRNTNFISSFDRLEHLHMYDCNVEGILDPTRNKDLTVNQMFPTLRQISIAGGKNPRQLNPEFLAQLLEMKSLESIFLCKFQWSIKGNEDAKYLSKRLDMKGTEKNFIIGKVPGPITRKSEIPPIIWKSRVPKPSEYHQILYDQFQMCDFFGEADTFTTFANLYDLKTKLL